MRCWSAGFTGHLPYLPGLASDRVQQHPRDDLDAFLADIVRKRLSEWLSVEYY
jgi:hypothetical protein